MNKELWVSKNLTAFMYLMRPFSITLTRARRFTNDDYYVLGGKRRLRRIRGGEVAGDGPGRDALTCR